MPRVIKFDYRLGMLDCLVGLALEIIDFLNVLVVNDQKFVSAYLGHLRFLSLS